jgi:hypothetical protein
LLTIEFDNPVFHDGVNVTVRAGDKWVKRLRLGDYFVPVKAGCVDDAPCHINCVIGLFYCPVDELPDGLLVHEHDPACRTREGLEAELERIYGNAKNRLVTAIVWHRKPKL